MENIAENNKLIAEFMGLKVITKDEYLNHPQHETLSVTEYSIVEYQRYHKEWNWLFEVVKKIESLSHVRGRHYYLFMEQAYVQIRVDRMNDQPFSMWGTSSNYDKFMAIYRAVVQFIEWYNLKKK